jgi:hypothetical protein
MAGRGSLMATVLLLAGTHDTQPGTWWQRGSLFTRCLEAHGHTLAAPGDGSSWTAELDGVLGQHGVWAREGDRLRAYLAQHPVAGVDVVIAFSHGGQVATYAAADGATIPHLITLGTPVRGDLEAVYAQARPRIGRWTHVYAVGGGDWWQLLGSLFDGVLRVWRAMPDADCNVVARGLTHRDLVDPAQWSARSWWRWLGDAAA